MSQGENVGGAQIYKHGCRTRKRRSRCEFSDDGEADNAQTKYRVRDGEWRRGRAYACATEGGDDAAQRPSAGVRPAPEAHARRAERKCLAHLAIGSWYELSEISSFRKSSSHFDRPPRPCVAIGALTHTSQGKHQERIDKALSQLFPQSMCASHLPPLYIHLVAPLTTAS